MMNAAYREWEFGVMERFLRNKEEVPIDFYLKDDVDCRRCYRCHNQYYADNDFIIVYLEDIKEPDKKDKPFTYVKKWMRTRHAIMFRLSNKIVQVCFQDKTEIILSSESRVVTYCNKKGERMTYPLSTALEMSNYEMTKRLKYTKDILTHMLTMNQQKNAQRSQNNNQDNYKSNNKEKDNPE